MLINRKAAHALAEDREKEQIRLDAQRLRKYVETNINKVIDYGGFSTSVDMRDFRYEARDKIKEELISFGYDVDERNNSLIISWD